MSSAEAPAERRRKANRLDLVSRLADDLAHEVKNPLNSAVVNLELVRRKAADDPDTAARRAAIVEEALDTVHDLVVALLGLLRPPAEAAAACSVASVVDEVALLAGARADLARVVLSVQMDDPGQAAVPAHLLQQVVLNLLDNALDATGAGGEIRLTAAGGVGGVELVVEDSGSGLDPAIADRIFEDGATTRPDRAGSGLAVCREILAAAGGTLAVEARGAPGGVTVRLTLPRPDA